MSEIIKVEKIDIGSYSSYSGSVNKDEFCVPLGNVIPILELLLEEITENHTNVEKDIIIYVYQEFEKMNEEILNGIPEQTITFKLEKQKEEKIEITEYTFTLIRMGENVNITTKSKIEMKELSKPRYLITEKIVEQEGRRTIVRENQRVVGEDEVPINMLEQKDL
jgi:hypothetical protein